MPTRKRHTDEQAVHKLRDIEVMLAQGKDLGLTLREAAISENTYHRWKEKFGLMSNDEVKKLKELEAENARLKKAVAELTLDNQIFKEVNAKMVSPARRREVVAQIVRDHPNVSERRACQIFGVNRSSVRYRCS